MSDPLHGYLSMLLAASVLGAVCATFAGGKFEKYLRYLASLICILLILSPFRSWSADALLQPDANGADTFSLPETDTLETRTRAMTEEQICRQIAAALSAQTGITDPTIRIDMEWTEQEAIVTAIHLTLCDTDASRAEAAMDYLTRTYGIPVTVHPAADTTFAEKE